MLFCRLGSVFFWIYIIKFQIVKQISQIFNDKVDYKNQAIIIDSSNSGLIFAYIFFF